MELLKNTGTQPVADDDIVWVVYNDGIYDYEPAWAICWDKTDEGWGVKYWCVVEDFHTEQSFFAVYYK